MIAALFVQKGGAYYGVPDVDPWDQERDARLYPGPWPVVAHPPCERWSSLAHIHKHKPGKGIGEDGGCFASALASVRRFGGVLEHPAGSAAWREFDLVTPPPMGWALTVDGGWVCEVEQGHYGHPAPKRTWLYAVSASPLPSLRWGDSGATARVELMPSTGRRSVTPPDFRDLLIGIASFARPRWEAA